MKRIILDTNFLLIPIQFKVDIFTEIDKICIFPYKLYIIEGTIDELNKIIEWRAYKSKDKLSAKIGLELLKGLAISSPSGDHAKITSSASVHF